jgi:hypothetical protein
VSDLSEMVGIRAEGDASRSDNAKLMVWAAL